MEAARSVGLLMKRHLMDDKLANETSRYDIKLELDVRCQKLIQRTLKSAFPNVSFLGEEGSSTHALTADDRWVVDPIDGTVNFAYTIPHACVSIALQAKAVSGKADYPDGYNTVVGIIYDPFCEEMFSAIRGQPAKMNGKPIRVSTRTKLEDCIVSIGFAKSKESLEATLPYFGELARRVRKIRMMGAAALGLAYVASGRFDAYIERGISLWDVAAGGLILECAGGEYFHEPTGRGEHQYRMVANNGLLRKTLRVPA